jgi:hypothetical protein
MVSKVLNIIKDIKKDIISLNSYISYDYIKYLLFKCIKVLM